MCGAQTAASGLAGLAAAAAAPRQLELRVSRARRAPADAVVRGRVGQVAGGDLRHSRPGVHHCLANAACKASRVRPWMCASASQVSPHVLVFCNLLFDSAMKPVLSGGLGLDALLT